MLFRAIDTNELELMLNGLPSGFVQFWGIFFLVEIVQKKIKTIYSKYSRSYSKSIVVMPRIN